MILSILLSLLISSEAQAWGGRGHHTICDAAVFLLKEEGLRDFLKSKPQIMGHLCNIPDTHWRNLAPEQTKLGNPTHYIDPEILGLEAKDVPLDFKKIVTEYTGKPNPWKEKSTIMSVPSELGSVWWRAEQFMKRIASLNFASAKAPENSKEEQNDELPYNKMVYSMMIDMGLMGHYVGDTAQPFHSTADYDGYRAGHGGIHAYYEEEVVSEFDGDLTYKVMQKARLLRKAPFLTGNSVVEKMRKLSDVSVKELVSVYKLDPVITPSTVNTDKGMEIKTAAKRKPASKVYKKMEPLIVEQMARASLLLAHFWDEAYAKAGRPVLKSYKNYRYPFTPDFVTPDYL